MTDQNPFAPPVSEVADVLTADGAGKLAGPHPKLVGALSLLQFGFMLLYAGVHLELVRTGAMSVLAYLLALMGAMALYVAAVRLSFRSKGKVAFIVAFLSFALALPKWGLGAFWSSPFWLGLVCAVYGAWVLWGRRA